tara:strand:+ start:592 stop:810 length:219 start_codon:yes stop_codon:yes gene_type:complete
MSSNKNGWFYAFVAGPALIGAAYGISSVLTGGESDTTGMSVAYGLLLWVGAPIAFVAVLPIFFGILKALTKS